MLVDVVVVNEGREIQRISRQSMGLEDVTGQRYQRDQSITTAFGFSTVDGPMLLSPGERLHFKMGYRVPTGVNGLFFFLDAEQPGAQQVTFNTPPPQRLYVRLGTAEIIARLNAGPAGSELEMAAVGYRCGWVRWS